MHVLVSLVACELALSPRARMTPENEVATPTPELIIRDRSRQGLPALPANTGRHTNYIFFKLKEKFTTCNQTVLHHRLISLSETSAHLIPHIHLISPNKRSPSVIRISISSMLSAAFLPPSPLLRHSSAASLISQARPRIMLRTRSLFPTKPPRCAQDPPSESSYLLDDATQQSSIASTLPPDVQPSQSTDKTAQQSPPIHSQQPPPMPGIVQSTAPLDPRVLFAEFLSTFLFVYLSVNAAATSVNPLANSVNNAAVIAAVAASFMPVSGAHLNPAVTLALAITNRVPLKRAIAFVPVQLLAAAAACMLAKILGVSVAFAGIAVDSSKAELVRAFFAELVPMFTIVIILFQTAVATETEGGVGAKLAALYIGLAVLACAGTFTTGVFNPARAFGPALVSSSFSNHWVYWLGPFVGATLAALVSFRHSVSKFFFFFFTAKRGVLTERPH